MRTTARAHDDRPEPDRADRTGPRPGFLRRHRLALALSVPAIGVAAWLAFGYFEVQALVIDDKVDEAAPTPTPNVTVRGTFVDRSHPTEGDALVITDGAQTYLRLEGFSTDNGPDLYVYLSAGVTKDAPAGELDDDFVDLGQLKGNIGAQNYEIPPGTDLARYRTVVVWCRRFTTAFGAADLAPI